MKRRLLLVGLVFLLLAGLIYPLFPRPVEISWYGDVTARSLEKLDLRDKGDIVASLNIITPY